MDPEYAAQYEQRGPIKPKDLTLDEFRQGLSAEHRQQLERAKLLDKVEPRWRRNVLAYLNATREESSAFIDLSLIHI